MIAALLFEKEQYYLNSFHYQKIITLPGVSDPPGLSTFTCISKLVNFHIYWSSWNSALLLIYHSFFFKVWIIFSQAWWSMWRWWRWLSRVSSNQANNSSWALWLSTFWSLDFIVLLMETLLLALASTKP